MNIIALTLFSVISMSGFSAEKSFLPEASNEKSIKVITKSSLKEAPILDFQKQSAPLYRWAKCKYALKLLGLIVFSAGAYYYLSNMQQRRIKTYTSKLNQRTAEENFKHKSIIIGIDVLEIALAIGIYKMMKNAYKTYQQQKSPSLIQNL